MSSPFYLDPNKPSQHILIDLMNHANEEAGSDVRYTYNQLYFQNAKENLIDYHFDTEVQVSDDAGANPAEDSEWFKFFYRRAKITQAFHRPNVEPVMPYDNGYATVYDMLTDINTFFGLGLSEDDVQDTAVPSTGDWPRAVTIKAKDGSLVYIGETQIYVDDPASPKFGLKTVTVASDTAIDSDFDRSLGIPTDHFQVSDNTEVEVASSCYLEPGSVATSVAGNVFTFNVDNGKHWTYVGSVGLYDQTSANVASLYIIELTVRRSDGTTVSTLRLSRREDNSIGFLSNDAMIWVPAQFVDGNDLVQFQINPVENYALFNGFMANTDGSILGEFQFDLTARKRDTILPPVTSSITVRPNIQATITAILRDDNPTTSVTLASGEDTVIPFTALVKVRARGGLNIGLASDKDYTVTLTSGATVSTIGTNGITMTASALHAPSGLAVGYYEVTGQLTIPDGWDTDAHDTVELVLKDGGTTLSTLAWTLS